MSAANRWQSIGINAIRGRIGATGTWSLQQIWCHSLSRDLVHTILDVWWELSLVATAGGGLVLVCCPTRLPSIFQHPENREQVESWSRFWSYVGLVNILNFKFSRDGDVWLSFWSNDPKGYFGKLNSTLGSVLPLAMFALKPIKTYSHATLE